VEDGVVKDSNNMLSSLGVAELERRIDQLIELCNRLREENSLLKARESSLMVERADLVDRNEEVRHRVETIINRLKELEHEN